MSSMCITVMLGEEEENVLQSSCSMNPWPMLSGQCNKCNHVPFLFLRRLYLE